MTMTSQFPDMTSLSSFMDVVLFPLSNLVTVPSFMSISALVLQLWQFCFIRDWSEIRYTPVRVFPNIWRLGQDRDTKFGTHVSNKTLLNATKCEGFWAIKGEPRGWRNGGGLSSPPIRLRLKTKISQGIFTWVGV